MIRSSAVNWIPNVNSKRMEKLDYAVHINNLLVLDALIVDLAAVETSWELIVSDVMWKIEQTMTFTLWVYKSLI